jgi:hypothetical protein
VRAGARPPLPPAWLFHHTPRRAQRLGAAGLLHIRGPQGGGVGQGFSGGLARGRAPPSAPRSLAAGLALSPLQKNQHPPRGGRLQLCLCPLEPPTRLHPLPPPQLMWSPGLSEVLSGVQAAATAAVGPGPCSREAFLKIVRDQVGGGGAFSGAGRAAGSAGGSLWDLAAGSLSPCPCYRCRRRRVSEESDCRSRPPLPAAPPVAAAGARGQLQPGLPAERHAARHAGAASGEACGGEVQQRRPRSRGSWAAAACEPRLTHACARPRPRLPRASAGADGADGAGDLRRQVAVHAAGLQRRRWGGAIAWGPARAPCERRRHSRPLQEPWQPTAKPPRAHPNCSTPPRRPPFPPPVVPTPGKVELADLEKAAGIESHYYDAQLEVRRAGGWGTWGSRPGAGGGPRRQGGGAGGGAQGAAGVESYYYEAQLEVRRAGVWGESGARGRGPRAASSGPGRALRPPGAARAREPLFPAPSPPDKTRRPAPLSSRTLTPTTTARSCLRSSCCPTPSPSRCGRTCSSWSPTRSRSSRSCR